METKRVPEPWDAIQIPSETLHGYVYRIGNAPGTIGHIATAFKQENAHRIVACVNACAGLTEDELGKFIDVRDRLAADNARLREALQRADSMRPVLLAQLGYVPEFVLDFCNQARAALKVAS